MTDQRPDKLASGQMVAGFRIDRVVGEGAMGVVYRAIQVKLERPVALKILPREMSKDKDFVDRFFNEARAAAAFSHPNIIQAYDAGIAEHDICYFAMEFVEGETLLERIGRDRRIPAITTLRIGLDIARALAYGWKHQRLTHGDIKPANIMITPRDQTKLADFGLAKMAGYEGEGEGIMLTPLYAAPEMIQGRGRTGDCRADIYSLGATLYHMVTGSPPFPGDDADKVMERQVHEALTPACDRSDSVPKAVSDLIGRLLEKTPEKRPQSWDEVSSEVDRQLQRLARSIMVARPAEAVAVAVAVATPAEQHPLHVRAIRAGGRHPRYHRSKGDRAVWLWLIGGLLLTLLTLLLLLWHLGHRGPTLPPAAAVVPADSPLPKVPADDEVVATPPMPVPSLWAEFLHKLRREPDPATAIRMLEDFRREHPQAVVEAEYRQALRQQQQSLQVQVTPESPVPAAVPVDIEAAPAPPPIEEIVEDATKPELSPEQLAERQEAWRNDYIELLFMVSRKSFTVDSDINAFARYVQEWLEQRDGEFGGRANVVFLHTTVIPGFQLVLPTLANNIDTLQGLALSELPGEELRKITTTGVETSIPIKGEGQSLAGSVSRRTAWKELNSGRAIMEMVRTLHGAGGLQPQEYQPFLSFFLLNGMLEPVNSLAVATGDPAKARQWQSLAAELVTTEREKKALEAWRKANEEVSRGALLLAHGLLQGLKAEPNSIRLRYADRIAALEKECEIRVPRVQAERLMQGGLDKLEPAPSQSLALISTASARYGNLDVVDLASLERLRSRAAEILARDLANRGVDLSSRWSFQPLLGLHQYTPIGEAAAALYTLRQSPDLEAGLRMLLMELNGLPLLELGDWGEAARALSTLPATLRHKVPGRLRISIPLAHLLLAERFATAIGAEQEEAWWQLQTMAARSASWHDRFTAASVLAQLAVLTRRHDLAAGAEWPVVADEPDEISGTLLRQYILSRTILLLEAGRAGEARAWLETLATGTVLQQSNAFSAQAWKSLVSLVTATADNRQSSLPLENPINRHPELFSRLALSNSLTGLAEGEQVKSGIVATLSGYPVGQGFLAGQTWFQRLLLQLTPEITGESPERALDRIQNNMEVHTPETTAYYSRLRILEAGVEMLNGRPEAAREVLMLIKHSTVASPGELKVAAFFDGPRRTPPPVAGKPSEGEFMYWQAFLSWAFQKGVAGDQKLALREASNLREFAPAPVERYLAGCILQAEEAGKTAR